MAGNLFKAVNWAIRTANDPIHGYDQAHRYGPDYDCSSFVAAALRDGGFSSIPATMYTGNEYSALTAAGFVPVTPIGSDVRAGDVFFFHLQNNNGHTCIAISDTQVAEATINEMGTITGGVTGDQTGQEIQVRNYYNPGWHYQMRYVEQLSWIHSNAALTQAEMENNATIICNILARQNWSDHAAAALLGNMQVESTINPGIWEDISDPSKGFGLVQWTPSTNYTDWATAHGYAIEDGDGQMTWILTETVSSGQWIPTADYPLSWSDFTRSTDGVTWLASAFLYNFERGAPSSEPARQEAAGNWLNWMGGKYITGCPAWLLFKFVERRRARNARSV